MRVSEKGCLNEAHWSGCFCDWSIQFLSLLVICILLSFFFPGCSGFYSTALQDEKKKNPSETGSILTINRLPYITIVKDKDISAVERWLWGCCETQHFLLLLVQMTNQKSSQNTGVAVNRWKVGVIRLIIKVRDMSIPQNCFYKNLDAAQSMTPVLIGRLGPPGWMWLLFAETTYFSPEALLFTMGFPPRVCFSSPPALHLVRRCDAWLQKKYICPEVTRGQEGVGIYSHRCRGRYKQVFIGDTVDVSADTGWRSPYPLLSFHFFLPSALCFYG